MSGARIRASHLSFSWPDGTSVFADLSFVFGPSRIGLVACNGAGKTTLLRLLAGELAMQAGTIDITGRVGYVRQYWNSAAYATVAELLGVTDALNAVDAVLAGTADAAQLERADGHWDLRERIASQLAAFDLHDVSLQREISTFSGGETMALALAAQLLWAPDVLLLDEPTNHLDRKARLRLRAVLESFRGCLLVASHDRDLLEGMQEIAELQPRRLRMVGGGYSAYRSVAEREQSAAEQQVQHLRKELRREKHEMHQARERADRRASNAARKVPAAGLPRIVAGTLAGRAEVSAGRAAGVYAERVDKMRNALQSAEQDAALSAVPRFSLPATRVGATQHVLTVENVQALAQDGPLWGARGITLTIRGPERIALVGDNGVGKTALLRILAREMSPSGGELRIGATHATYLSQRLDQLAPAKSLAENFEDKAARLSLQERADLLARLGFRGDRMKLPVAALSGGERLRATLACVLHADESPQLLLLDEPTNNLDLDAVLQLEQLLQSYEGAMVLVSHDTDFIESIKPTRHLSLTAKGLVELPR